MNPSAPVRFDRRGLKNQLDPLRPFHFLNELERAESGELVSVATVFLTNRECPWRCVMCDLWKNTLDETVPPGAIPQQIDYALQRLPTARHIKLYNSGSFFDPAAIPEADSEAIAQKVSGFERVIVECHPSLVNERSVSFRDLLKGRLEVAMGLESIHPAVVNGLNKRMSLELFQRAAEFLSKAGIAMRTFVLMQPPFVPPAESVEWTVRSVRFAFECEATAVSVIPTRGGNHELTELAVRGLFESPTLTRFEEAIDESLNVAAGRLFSDTWDLERFSECGKCFPERRDRLIEMNHSQQLLPKVICDDCT